MYQMKKYKKYLVLMLAAMLTVACRGKHSDIELTESQKLEVLDLKLEKHPNDHALLAERSQVLINLGRVREALTDINKAVELKPNNIDYRLIQADAAFANGEIEKSYGALTEAERLAPDNKDVHLKMGEITFYARDYDRSLQNLTLVTEVEPDNRTALFMKGFIYKEKGDTANAVTLMRRVCDLYPDYAPAFEELGVLYATHLNPMAVEYLTTAINLEPNNTNAMYALAMYYQGLEELDQAESLYRKILDINPKSADSWHNLGYLELAYYHDYPRAIQLFDSALAADPTHAASLTNRELAKSFIK